jgi:hypothetical protein
MRADMWSLAGVGGNGCDFDIDLGHAQAIEGALGEAHSGTPVVVDKDHEVGIEMAAGRSQ